MVPDSEGILKPAKSIEEILNIVPSIKEMAEVVFEEIENRDSTNINPVHWVKLAEKIANEHNRYDGILVTHGTDTMAYTASAISFALGRGLKIPVVFTGAQLPLVSFGTDARFNLENAVKTILKGAEDKVAEVMIVFSDRVLRANRTIKTSESRFPAFDSPAYSPLATITAMGLTFAPDVLKVDPAVPLQPQAKFHRGILTIDLVPGLEPGILSEVLHSGKCQGLLLKSLGAGNVPTEDEYSLIPIIKEATQLGIPVLVATKFIGGNTHSEVYETGKLAIDAGAIPTGDMTDVAAQVKFMWALANGYETPTALRRVINQNLAGEITAC